MEYDFFNKYPDIKLIKLEGGYTNEVFFLEGANLPVIAKIYGKENTDAKIEFNALTFMNNSDVTPKVYEYFEDNSKIYVIMEYIRGKNGQIYLDNLDLNKTFEIYKLLGNYLATKVHSIKPNENTLNFFKGEFEILSMDSLKFLPPNILIKVKKMLNINIKEEITLTHGDYGPHNTLVFNDGLKIIDWEWAGWGNPQLDVAWVIWFVCLHYPNICKKLSKIFLDEYCKNRIIEINEEIIKAFSIYKVIKILERAVTVNEETKNEWIRRLEWTIGADFNV